MPDDITIRVATPDDAASLLAIYAPYVEGTAITFETVVPSVDDFRARIERTLARYPYLVADQAGRAIGYAYAGTFKARAAYDWAIETSIYVAQDVQARGVGRSLYGTLENILARQGVINLNASIASTRREADPYLTDGSIRFHEKLGYSLVGTFHNCGFKLGRWYDMTWMEKFLAPHPVPPQPFVPFPLLVASGEYVLP